MHRACFLLLLAACGGSDAAPDATVPDAEPEPCNTIEDVAPADVVEIGIAEAGPTPTGGSIADGTYVLTAAAYYTGAGGQTGETGVVYHATSVNEGGAYQYLDTGSNPPTITAGVYQTSGTDDIDVLQQCPTLSPLTFNKVSASSTEFTLFETVGTAVHTLTFTKQ